MVALLPAAVSLPARRSARLVRMPRPIRQPRSRPLRATGDSPQAPKPSGVRLIKVEETSTEAWAGVSTRDDGVDPADAPKRSALLAAGDLAALVLFAAVGRANHGEGDALGAVLVTAAPFVAAWALAAAPLGAFGPEARGRDVPAALLAGAKAWALAAPLGLALRAVSQGGRAPPLPFVLVTLLAGGGLLLAWRGLAAATAPTAKRGSRQGSPLEFFSFLAGMTKRW